MSEGKLIARTETESIYNDCIEPKNTLDAEKVRRHLEAMLLEIASNFDDTINNTQDFSKIIDEHLNRFERQGDPNLTMKEAMFLIQKLITGSDLIKKTTKTFIAQLEITRQQITTLQNELHKARSEAIHDALTGLFNRRALELESAELGEQKIPYSIVMFDIDHFKMVNDVYGHLNGDEVLRRLAQILKEDIRSVGRIYRYGGEEFFAILESDDGQAVYNIIEGIRLKLKEQIFEFDQELRVTFSAGILRCEDTVSVDKWITDVDALLYEAKETGRDRIRKNF